MRNLKALGLLLLAIGGLASVAAPAAMATPEFTAFNTSTEEHPSEASIHGVQLGEGHKFTAGSGASVTCGTATFTGSLTGAASSSLTVEASYSECTGPLGEAADVNMNGCKYVFHPEAETAENQYSAKVDVSCPESKGPTVKTTTEGGGNKCVIQVEANQKGLSSVHIKEIKGEMEFEIAVEKLAYTSEGGILNCGVANGGHTDGKYSGKSTVTASQGETALYLQMADGDLVASPTAFSKKEGESETVKLTSKSGDTKLLIVDERGAGTVFELVKKCSGKFVPCTAELKCKSAGDDIYEVLGLTGDNKYTLVNVGVTCTKK